ncbi:hypothetical protein CHUAL_001841 [Chamberlinius hualienensis]
MNNKGLHQLLVAVLLIYNVHYAVRLVENAPLQNPLAESHAERKTQTTEYYPRGYGGVFLPECPPEQQYDIDRDRCVTPSNYLNNFLINIILMYSRPVVALGKYKKTTTSKSFNFKNSSIDGANRAIGGFGAIASECPPGQLFDYVHGRCFKPRYGQ